MKKKTIVLLVLVLLMTFIFTGCGTTKENSAISKQAMNDYYTYYNNGQIDGCLAIIHPSLADALGGTEATKDILTTRLEYYGNVIEYDINQTGFETANGESEFFYTVTAKYESGDEFEETFTIFVSNGVAQIIVIDI